VIITSPQKPSRSFYPRGFCFALVRCRFRVAPLGYSGRSLSERGDMRRPRHGAWAGLVPVVRPNRVLTREVHGLRRRSSRFAARKVSPDDVTPGQTPWTQNVSVVDVQCSHVLRAAVRRIRG
jgi:hypothetical protein